MDWELQNEFEAISPEQFPAMLDAFLPDRGDNEAATVERFQLTKLLGLLFTLGKLRFPLKLTHSSTLTPDSHLYLGAAKNHIGVELTRLALRNVEQARKIHALQGAGVLSSSVFYKHGLPELEDSEIRKRAINNVTPPFFSPPTEKESQEVWLERFCEGLEKKTIQFNKTHFKHGEEDWLVIWDRLRVDFWPLENRMEELEQVLTLYWNRAKWFDKVFIQDQHFRWTISGSRDESPRLTLLPSGE